jgi:hypothetical protein
MTAELVDSGRFSAWLTLPREPEWTSKSLTYILAANIAWFLLFFVGSHIHPLPASLTKNMKKEDLFHIRYRLICCYHGISALFMAFIWHLIDNDRTCSKRITDFELLMLVNTSSHLLWDTIFMKYYDFLDFGNLMHHMIGIIGYNFTVFSQHNFNMLVINLLPGEMTNASMHLRDILRRLGWRYTLTYYANEYYYSFAYMFCRSWWLPSAYYWIYPCITVNPTVFIMYPLHCVQSWYYVSKLPKMVMYRMSEQKKLKDAGLKVEWFKPIAPKKAAEVGIKVFEAYKM